MNVFINTDDYQHGRECIYQQLFGKSWGADSSIGQKSSCEEYTSHTAKCILGVTISQLITLISLYLGLLVLSRQTLLITSSLTCSFDPYHTHNYLSSCGSVGRATVICSEGHGFESHWGMIFFSFCLYGPISFQGSDSEKYYLL